MGLPQCLHGGYGQKGFLKAMWKKCENAMEKLAAGQKVWS